MEWFYEWNLPHSDTTVYKQFINDAYTATLPIVPPAVSEPLVEVPPPPSQAKSPLPPSAARSLTELRDLLGADYGAVLDAHNDMSALAGKQLPKATYEANSRTLTGLLTALQIDMIPFFLEDDPATLRTFMHWFSNACEDAREWDYRPTSKDQLIQQKAMAVSILEATPDQATAPQPPEPPTQQATHLLANQPPFSLNQPDVATEVAAIHHAATGEALPSSSSIAEDFHPAQSTPSQPPADVVLPASAQTPAHLAEFTAPPS
jgi:hypothetical protein